MMNGAESQLPQTFKSADFLPHVQTQQSQPCLLCGNDAEAQDLPDEP